MSAFAEALFDTLDERTIEILDRRRSIPHLRRRGWLVRRVLLASDMVGLAIAFALTSWIFDGTAIRGRFDSVGETLLFLAFLPVWIVMAKLYGLYDRDEERADHSGADDVFGVFHLVTVGTWLLFAVISVTHIAHVNVHKLITFWLIAILAIALARSGGRALCRRSVAYLQNTLILGAGDVGQEIAAKLVRHPEYGLNVVGLVDSEPKERREDLEHVCVFGGLDEVSRLVQLLDVERVVIAFSNDEPAEVLQVLRDLNKLDIQVDIVPRYFDVVGRSVDLHGIQGIPLIGLRPPRLSSSSALMKRSFDVIGALFGIVLLLPFFLIVAIAIRLDSRGPVFFRQQRVGASGTVFEILKFRTMHVGADDAKRSITHLNKHVRNGGDTRMFKIDRDPRVTRLGRALRRYSIDELPQLWNVVRGEMSLIGPRPLILEEHFHVSGWEERRLDLRPGITGLWQVLGRDDLPFGEMVKLDYQYVTGWSLGNDLRLLLRTVPVVLRRGA